MEIIRDLDLELEQLADSGYSVKIEQYITKGFILFRKKPELFLLYTALYIISIPLGGVIISFPLAAGFFIAAHRLNSGKSLFFDHFFDGFKFFIPLILIMLVEGIFVFLGFFLLIFPGIYLIVAYYFAPLFVIFHKMDFRKAMKTSRNLIHKKWFSIFGFMIILGLINFLGALALGVGALFTIPITFCSIYAAFDDIVGVKDQAISHETN